MSKENGIIKVPESYQKRVRYFSEAIKDHRYAMDYHAIAARSNQNEMWLLLTEICNLDHDKYKYVFDDETMQVEIAREWGGLEKALKGRW